MLLNFLLFIILIFTSIFLPNSVLSESSKSSFTVPEGLEGRVEFWKLIFTKYGKDTRVFHHRSHPEIIYSVLDFSELEASLTGRELLAAKELEINSELDNIKNALIWLSKGEEPRNDFEERIEKLFKQIHGHSKKKYIEAIENDQIRYQTGIKERFKESLVRSGRYLKTIEKIFEAEGLPKELARVPFIESSFDYSAYSSVGAAGIWQFMPATAKKYMKVNNIIDERRDPIISSRGAAKYLKNSYEDTGVWSLAITSYNHGLTGILRAANEVGSNDIVKIIRNYKAKSFGFASSNFYAEFLAALEIDENAKNYFPDLVREEEIHFDEIVLGSPITFKHFKSISGTQEDELLKMNRSFSDRILNNLIPIPKSTLVKVKKGNGINIINKVNGSRIFYSTEYSSNSNSLEDLELGEEISKETKNSKKTYNKTKKQTKVNTTTRKNTKKVYHIVKKGESISTLSKKYKISENTIKKLNGLSSKSIIKKDSRLLVSE